MSPAINLVETKDPAESKFYSMNWAPRLNPGATIATSVWTVQVGLTLVSDSIVSGNLKTTAKFSGGQDGVDYAVINTVTTSDAETLVQHARLTVKAEGAFT